MGAWVVSGRIGHTADDKKRAARVHMQGEEGVRCRERDRER